MTVGEVRMTEEQKNKRFNPCCYCKATMSCGIDCEARIGFNNIITAKLDDCLTRKRTDSDWQADLEGNAKKYGLPVAC